MKMGWCILLIFFPSVLATCPLTNTQGDQCKVTVATGTVERSGTDADVYIVFYGKVSSSRFYPDSPNDDFETGSVGVYYTMIPDLFPLTHIDVGHDNTGEHSGWYLNSIDVYCPNAEIDMHFPAYRWLALDEADGRLEVTIWGQSNRNCPVRQPIMNGSMSCTFGRAWGSRCSISCDTGLPIGPSCIKCLGTQQWDHSEGSTTCDAENGHPPVGRR